MDKDLKVLGTYPRVFKEWNISVTLIKTSDNSIYFPIKHVCEQIGVDPDRQKVKINADPDLSKGVADLPVPTGGGTQHMACIRKKELAWWLIHIDDARCKKHIRGHLQEIKQILVEAAEKLLFGDIEHVADENARGVLATSAYNEIIFACLECGAKYKIIITDGNPIVMPIREE